MGLGGLSMILLLDPWPFLGYNTNITKEPTMATTEAIRQVLEAAGSSLVSVRFIKKDGTERQLTGNLLDHNDIKGTGTPAKDPNIVRIRDIKLGQWRSFDCSRVVSIKSKGQVHTFS